MINMIWLNMFNPPILVRLPIVAVQIPQLLGEFFRKLRMSERRWPLNSRISQCSIIVPFKKTYDLDFRQPQRLNMNKYDYIKLYYWISPTTFPYIRILSYYWCIIILILCPLHPDCICIISHYIHTITILVTSSTKNTNCVNDIPWCPHTRSI